jgi:hypothetical protein
MAYLAHPAFRRGVASSLAIARDHPDGGINRPQAKPGAVSQQADRTIRPAGHPERARSFSRPADTQHSRGSWPAQMLALASRNCRAGQQMTSSDGQARGDCPRGGARQCALAARKIDGRGSDPSTLPRRFSRGHAEPQAAAVAAADRRPVAAEAAGAGARITTSGSRPRCACCTPRCT